MNGQNGQFGPGTSYGNVNRPSFFPGRIINNTNEITPQDVPPDGSIAVFILNDFSAIYIERWTKDGTIDVKPYVPQQALQAVTAQQANASEAYQNQVLSYLESIERKLGKSYNYKPNYRKPQDRQERSGE